MSFRPASYRALGGPRRIARRTIAGVVLTSILGILVLQLALAGFAAAAITAGTHTLAMTNPTSGNAAKSISIARPAATSNGTLLLAQITFEKGKDAGTDVS